MNAPPSTRLSAARISFDSLTLFLCSFVIFIAALDLTGWILKLPRLTSILLQYATMKPNTATGLALVAVSILLLRRPATQDSKKRTSASNLRLGLALLFLTAIFFVASGTLMEYVTGRNLGLDLLVLKVDPDSFSKIPGRMSEPTAVSFILLTTALALLDRRPRLSLGLVISAGGLCLSAMIGFLFEAGPLLGMHRLQPIALPTAAAFLLLEMAVLCIRPDREPLCSLAHATRSGRKQWLLLGVTILPVLVAIPLMIAQHFGLLYAPLALAILVVVLICIQTLILWQDSKALAQVEDRRRRAEQALLQSEKLAVVGRLAASISHEINNPLEAISNILYLIRDADSLDSAREYSLMAEQELTRVAQITTQTLSFYRELRHPALYLPNTIVDSALTLLSGKISTARVAIRIDFHEGVQPVLCREGELRQVFVNLLSNAVEATPPGGQLVVRVRPSSSWRGIDRRQGVRILIADSGRGIAPHFRDRIFEPFFTTKAHETGNGLGLWVVADLVEKQGGTIRMRSSQLRGWQGTTFCVFLPLPLTVPAETYGIDGASSSLGPGATVASGAAVEGS